MKKLFGFSFAALSLMAAGLTSCQSEDVLPIASNEVEMVHVVAIADAGSKTRTSKPMEDNGDLSFQWAENDQIVIFTKDGLQNCGVLKLKEGVGDAIGTFEGELGIPSNESEVHVYYFGAAKTSYLSDIDRTFDLELSNQNGAYGHHVDYDIMHAVSPITRGENNEILLNFNIEGILSLAHFRLNLPENVKSESDVTVNGKNMVSFATLDLATATFVEDSKKYDDITVSADWTIGNENQGDLYIAVVPGANIDTEFTVISTDARTLKGAAKNRTYKVNGFFNGASVYGKDIYFSEDGAWTLTYMNEDGTKELGNDSGEHFGPAYTFTVKSFDVENGYKLEGWSTTPNGSVEYNVGDDYELTRPDTDGKLYAVTSAILTNFTLIGDVNGGEGNNKSVTATDKTWPCTLSTNDFGAAPTREGFKFLGWTLTKDGNDFVTEYTFNYNETTRTVYAKWEREYFTVKYIDGADNAVFGDEIHGKNKVGDPTPPFDGSLNRTGYKFLGWSPEIKSVISAADADANGVITYMATWEKIEKSEATVGTPGSKGTTYGGN